MSAPEVNLGPVKDDGELIDKLHSVGFKEIVFPGTTTDLNKYLKWHKDRKGAKNSYVETCEGMGVTFRLRKTEPGSILREITDFFKSDVFLNAISAKFGLSLGDTYPD